MTTLLILSVDATKLEMFRINPEGNCIQLVFLHNAAGTARLKTGESLLTLLDSAPFTCEHFTSETPSSARGIAFEAMVTIHNELLPKAEKPIAFVQVNFSLFNSAWFIPVYE